MNPKLNILFLASWYPSRVHKTLGNFVQRHAEAVSRFHRVCVVTAVDAGFDDVELRDKGNLFEIIVYYRKHIPVLSFRKAMRKGVKKSGDLFPTIDLVHVHVAYPAGLVAKKLGKPVVLTEHFSGYYPQSGQHWGFLKKHLTKRVLKSTEVIMPVSRFLADAMSPYAPNAQYRAIPNVVNCEIFKHGQRTSIGKFTFLHISTLQEKSKNITGLLKGFRILAERGIAFELRIGGDGDLIALEKKIADAGIPSENVSIFSEKPIEGVAELMRNADCLVMFSHFETQSCTILEALCSGMPVVSSAVGGIPEIITPANGILVTPNDTTEFADALQKMINERANYNSKEISAVACSKYAYPAVAAQISEVYFSVLNKAASGQ